MSKIKLEDCRTGADYHQYFQALEDDDVSVESVGSFLKVTNLKTGQISYIPKTSRTLPKTTRNSILANLIKIGLVTAILVSLVIVLT